MYPVLGQALRLQGADKSEIHEMAVPETPKFIMSRFSLSDKYVKAFQETTSMTTKRWPSFQRATSLRDVRISGTHRSVTESVYACCRTVAFVLRQLGVEHRTAKATLAIDPSLS